MDELQVRIAVDVNPTEDLKKVKEAVENIFGPLDFQVLPRPGADLLRAETKGKSGLARIHDLLRRQRIRDAARGALFEGLRGSSITFYLNKQVAYAGRISFSNPEGESPLGPIKARITCDQPREVIEWMAPKTTR